MARNKRPNQDQGLPKWRVYERIAAALEAEDIGMDATIASDVHVTGRYSHTSRQIDALIEARWPDGVQRRILVDAKRRRRKLDVNDIGAFTTTLDDCSAERGILYSPVGWTTGAANLARELVRVKLLDDEQLEEEEWAGFDRCEAEAEPGGEDGDACRGVLLWDGQLLDSLDGTFWAIYHTGACDVCHRFHVWCWDCGERFPIPIDGEVMCGCERLWMCRTRDEPVPGTCLSDRYGYLFVAANGRDFHQLDRIILTSRRPRAVVRHPSTAQKPG